MSERRDLDPYRPTGSAASSTIARRAARTLGVLSGLAVSLYGAALYALRCFDTCPSDPAENASGQLLSGAFVLFGIAVVVTATTAGTRGGRTGLTVVCVVSCLVAACGAVSLALVPAIDGPGDHGGYVLFGLVALALGGISAGAAYAYLRRAPR